MTWHQFIPCLDPLKDKDGTTVLTAKEYGTFLCNLFDRWYDDLKAGKYVYNRTFENYVGILAGRPPEDCSMCGFCTVQFVLEADGGVYPCDFYVLDEYKLGNFVTDSLEDILARADEIGFVQKSHNLPSDCKKCEWVMLCRGGCRRNREPYENDEPSGNRFCEGYKMFFEHTHERLIRIARTLVERNRNR